MYSLLDGKATSIEEDIHVPFYIRGPGIPAGRLLPHQGNMVDMAPTVLALAGGCCAAPPLAFDPHTT